MRVQQEPSAYLGILLGQALAQLISIAQMGLCLSWRSGARPEKASPGEETASAALHRQRERRSLLLAGESPEAAGTQDGEVALGSCPALPWGCSDPHQMPMELMLSGPSNLRRQGWEEAIGIYPKGNVLTWGDQEHRAMSRTAQEVMLRQLPRLPPHLFYRAGNLAV